MDQADINNNSPQDLNDKSSSIKYMRNKVNCQIWTNADFEKLQEGVKQYGKNWHKIRDMYFQDRQPNCLKCKYNYFLRKQKQQNIDVSEKIYNQQIKKESTGKRRFVSNVELFPRVQNNHSSSKKHLNNSINSVFSDIKESYINTQKNNQFNDLFNKSIDELSQQLINNRYAQENQQKSPEQSYQITKQMPVTQSVDMIPYTMANDSQSVGAMSIQSWGMDFENLGFSENNE